VGRQRRLEKCPRTLVLLVPLFSCQVREEPQARNGLPSLLCFLFVEGPQRPYSFPSSRSTLASTFELPVDAVEPRDEIEVPVSAQQGKRMLTAESRDPNVIGRNRGSGSFEFTANGSIGGRCLLLNVQDPEFRKVFNKPVFVALA
jgi:hypothetical protein